MGNKINNFKKYIIGFLIGISFVVGVSYASTGTIGGLFEKISGNWKLVGTNIKDATIGTAQLGNDSVTTAKIVDNSIDNNKLDNFSSFTMAGLTVNGTARATSFLYTSDERYKENIYTIENSLEKINLLRGVSWNWKETKETDMGFIAQEVEKVIPELVVTDEDGYKSVKYGNMVGILVEAIKEQQEQIKKLEEEIKRLEKNK